MPTFFFLRCCSCLLCRLMLITCFIELRHREIIQTQGERKVLEKKKEFLDWADFMAAVLRCYFAHTPLSTHLDLISIFSLFCLLYKKMIVLRWIEKINSFLHFSWFSSLLSLFSLLTRKSNKLRKVFPYDFSWCASMNPANFMTSNLINIISFLSSFRLKLECEKLASEKTEMQRHYVMVSTNYLRKIICNSLKSEQPFS